MKKSFGPNSSGRKTLRRASGTREATGVVEAASIASAASMANLRAKLGMPGCGIQKPTGLPQFSHSPFSRRGCRSEEHTSELQSLMRISYAVFCLKKKKKNKHNTSAHFTSSEI